MLVCIASCGSSNASCISVVVIVVRVVIVWDCFVGGAHWYVGIVFAGGCPLVCMGTEMGMGMGMGMGTGAGASAGADMDTGTGTCTCIGAVAAPDGYPPERRQRGAPRGRSAALITLIPLGSDPCIPQAHPEHTRHVLITP